MSHSACRFGKYFPVAYYFIFMMPYFTSVHPLNNGNIFMKQYAAYKDMLCALESDIQRSNTTSIIITQIIAAVTSANFRDILRFSDEVR
jgi:hypothetical protein